MPACASGVRYCSGTLVWWMTTSVRPSPRSRERARVRHPALDVGLGPHDPLGLDDLDEHAAGRVLLAVLVVHHDGLEAAAGVGLDDDPVEGRADADRTPEVGEVLGLDHAAEHELARCVVDAGDRDFAEGGGFAHFGCSFLVDRLGADFLDGRAGGLDGAEVLVEPVEPFVPLHAVAFDPLDGLVERLGLEPARPVLRLLTAADQTRRARAP